MLDTRKIDQVGVSMSNPFNPAGTGHMFGIMAFTSDGKPEYLDHSVSESSCMAEALSKLYDWYDSGVAEKHGLRKDSVRKVFYNGASYA